MRNVGKSGRIDHHKELTKLLRKLGNQYSIWRVYEDFLAMAAISVSNAVDWAHCEERETQYMEIVGHYEKGEAMLFAEMLAHLVQELEWHAGKPRDVLGEVFHELELHNKYHGQFFTPQNVCDMMGAITLGGGKLPDKGYHSVCEPCAGSGAMILGFVNAMVEAKQDYHRNMVVKAMDIDLKCVHMCYLQLSLYGIPAVVVHGNTLTLEEYSHWYTPVYMLDGWAWRGAKEQAEQPKQADERGAIALITDVPSLRPAAQAQFDITLNESDNGQLSFGL